MAAVYMKANAGGYGGNFERTLTTPAGAVYRFSAWSFLSSNAAGCQIRYYFQPVTPEVANPFQSVDVVNVAATRGVWTELKYTFTSGTGGVRRLIAQIYCSSPATPIARTIYFDDIVLEKV